MVHNLETPHTARRTSYIKTEVIKSASVHCLSLFFPSYFAVWSFHPEGIANAPGNLAKHVAPHQPPFRNQMQKRDDGIGSDFI